MLLYRIGNYFYRKKIPLLPRFFNILIRIVHNCAVFSETDIGEGTKFGYGGIGVVIHKRAIIGRNCSIGTNVTIGGRSKHKEVPVIGNNVYLATGSKILGPVHVGDGAVIGANAVVLSDIPANSIAVGVPAKVIKNNINAEDYK